jgi:UDP-3-O-[3-hydroxymyristoyl] glucosamine N-acyltransferase
MLLSDLVTGLDVEVVGDPNVDIMRVRSLRLAGEGDLSFSKWPEWTTCASAVVIPREPRRDSYDCTVILADKPRNTACQIARRIDMPAMGVHPTAFLDSVVAPIGVTVGHGSVIGGVGFGFFFDENGNRKRIPHAGKVIIGEDVEIGSNTCIDRGSFDDTVIGDRVKIDNLVHIAHNAKIGNDVGIVAHAMIAGSVEIGDGAWIGPGARVLNGLKIGANAVVGMGAVVIRDVPANTTVVGNPARPIERKSQPRGMM